MSALGDEMHPHPVTGQMMRLRVYACVSPSCGSRRAYWMTDFQYGQTATAAHRCACGSLRSRSPMTWVTSLPDDMIPTVPTREAPVSVPRHLAVGAR